MYLKYIIAAITFVTITTLAPSCKKFLETKSVQTLATPSTLDDLQAILDNPSLSTGVGLTYGGTDEYYCTFTDWNSRLPFQKKSYIWDGQLDFFGDWDLLYRNVFYSNNVLLNLRTIDANKQSEKRNNIEGSAYFVRAHCFYQLEQVYAPQYDPATASSDLGIVLRLNADINEQSQRSSVQATYDQIITDLTKAISLLPTTTNIKIRPSKAAAYALLARLYLQIGNYTKAKENAEACLAIYSTLMNYNNLLPVTPLYPMPSLKNNQEIIYYTRTETPLNANYVRAKVDSNLYRSFDDNDLSKRLFFRNNGNGTFGYVGNYTKEFALFNGLATDEVYLIKAEAEARLGNKDAALNSLNDLLITRWESGAFMPFTAASADQALMLILDERKKHLINRGTRWSDLRRLNKETRFAITLKRILNAETYELPPNDPRYIYLIPLQVMNSTNLQQNPR